MFKRISRLALTTSFVATLLLSGCGGGTPPPTEGKVTVNPEKTTASFSGYADGCAGNNFVYYPFTIAVTDGHGIPVPDAPLSVTLDWSTATTTSGTANLLSNHLYDDPAWNGSSTTAPTNEVGGSYSTTTGSDGTKRLIVGADVGCTSLGYLSVNYHQFFAQGEISITSN